MLGWIGVGMLTLAYFVLVFISFRGFAAVNTVASTTLTIHAYMINDVPFMLVNGFIACVMLYKYIETYKEEENGIR